MSNSEIVPWPETWPLFRHATASFENACDVLVGPCLCGASHGVGEFEYRDGQLYRFGKLIPVEFVMPRENNYVFRELDTERDAKAAGYDHVRVVCNNDYVGFRPLQGKRVYLQRCPRCHRENYVLAVTQGACCWCGLDANLVELQPKEDL